MIIILHGHIRNFIWVSDLWKSNITGGSHFRTLPVFEYGMILHKWKAIRVSTTKACKGNNRREKKLYDYNEIVLFWNTVLWSDFSQKKWRRVASDIAHLGQIKNLWKIECQYFHGLLSDLPVVCGCQIASHIPHRAGMMKNGARLSGDGVQRINVRTSADWTVNAPV